MTTENHNSISELVYLFVDGETTSTQEEILFNTLAGNPELQQELHEAILIRSTLEQDCSALSVPPDTTAAIFQTAGFALPGVAGGVSLVNSFLGTVTSTLKSVVIPAFFVISGAAISTVYFMFHNPATENLATATVPLKNGSNTIINVREAIAGNTVKKDNSTNSQIRYSNSGTGSKHSLPSVKDSGLPNHLYHLSNRERNEVQEFQKTSMQESMDETTSITQNNSEVTQLQTSSLLRSPTDKHFTPNFATSASPIKDFPNSQNIQKTSEESATPITVALRGLMDISTFPSVGKTTYNNEFNNIAVSVGYRLNENINIGVEGGRQSLHYYTFENGRNENSTLHTSIDWAGVFYKQRFSGLTFSELTPYSQITLGGTVSGPSCRLLTGISWQPDSRISLSAGIEGTAFLYQRSTTWYSLRALGFLYQVEVNF